MIRKFDKQPQGVPNFIWIIYEETWKRYSTLNKEAMAVRSYQITVSNLTAELGVLERIIKGFTVTAYRTIEDLFKHHRDMDIAAGVPITTEGLNAENNSAA